MSMSTAPATSPARLVILISGSGSNLQAVMNACREGKIFAQVAAVISNRREAYGLERARLEGVPAIYFPKSKEMGRVEYDRLLANKAAEFQPDWVLLLGWMRMLSQPFLDRFTGRVVNIHPALPGTFPGIHAIERAYQAYQNKEIQHTGVMVHLVPNEGMDDGPLLGQETVPIYNNDSLETLETRMHQTEHRLLITILTTLLGSKISD